VKLNGILECKFLSKTRTVHSRARWALATDSCGNLAPCKTMAPLSFHFSQLVWCLPSVLCDVISAVAEFMVSITGPRPSLPSALRHNLQCQLARGVNTREECHWPHTWPRFTRSKGVNPNGILERNTNNGRTRSARFCEKPSTVQENRLECVTEV
jgi:hypothetical protein